MPRLDRKNDHIYSIMHRAPGRADFSDISFVHNCLPDLDYDQICLDAEYMGRTFRSPLFINAITGGTKLALKINAALAQVARELGLAMAVGSQMAALEDKAAAASFKIARLVNPEGVIWANIGSYANPDMARRAVEMIGADGLQIHLNVPQELVMKEGERKFRGMISRIRQITKEIEVPVMIKEVGFGISGEQALVLIDCKVNAIDVGGKGGTNFLSIESRRSGKRISRGLRMWGIPTAISLIEVANAAGNRADLIATGGMHTAPDIARALALGANAVGMAGMPVYLLLNKGRDALKEYIKTIERELSIIMMMTGASSISDMRKVPLVITGFTAEWMKRRGIDPSGYALRTGHISK